MFMLSIADNEEKITIDIRRNTDMIGLFSETDNEKYIIMVSDGKIDMPDREERAFPRAVRSGVPD